jgi:hypothetical protein
VHVQIIQLCNPVIISDSKGIQETQFDITFRTPEGNSIDAYLRIIHKSSKIPIKLLSKAIVENLIDVKASVENIYEFSPVLGEGVECIRQIDDRGHVYFEGRVAEFLTAGQGFVFEAGNFGFVLDLRIIPDGFLDEDLDPGKWICFKAERLYLWSW